MKKDVIGGLLALLLVCILAAAMTSCIKEIECKGQPKGTLVIIGGNSSRC